MCDESTLNLLNYIKRQFLCCVPIKQFDFKDLFEKLDDSNLQECLIDNTIRSKLNLRYPIKINYSKSFIKHVIDQLEERRRIEETEFEINDSIYDAFGRLMALPEENQHFKHYFFNVDCGDNVILKENSQFVSDGTTGLCTWQAGVVLAEWCRDNPILTNKNVLELGSGVGFTGIVICKFSKPKKFVFTDCHVKVLNTLNENVKLNLNINEINKSDDKFTILNGEITNTSTQIEILNLPWDDVSEETKHVHHTDILLAADIVYDSTLFTPLIGALECFFKRGSCKIAYMASTERNPETLGRFLNLLEGKSFKIEKLEAPQSKYYFWDKTTRIYIYKITV